MASSTFFSNVYAHRRVAETKAKPCEICFRPSSSVLITLDNKVRFYLFSFVSFFPLLSSPIHIYLLHEIGMRVCVFVYIYMCVFWGLISEDGWMNFF